MESFAPLAPGPAVPANADVVAAIAAGFPAAQRARAEQLLGAIVAWNLRSIATFPKPRRLVEVVYENLTGRLGPLAGAARLAELELIGCEIEGQQALGGANSLAAARYLVEHPGKAAPAPWAEDVQPWSGRSAAELTAEADRRLAELERLQRERTGACAEALRESLLHARFALAAAKSGAFGTASGPFADFLRAMGESPSVLEMH